MQAKTLTVLAAASLLCLATVAGAALTTYTQDFESMIQTDPVALSNDGWIIYGNVYTAAEDWIYGYGTFPAPNHNLAFSNLVIGEGGDDQGLQQLSIFSDYENLDHANPDRLIESNVFQEQVIAAIDLGKTFRFSVQAKRGNISGSSTAHIFIKTIDPSNNWAMTNLIVEEMTAIPDTWGGYSVQLDMGDPALEGQYFQFGFMCVASQYEPSGIVYDNVVFEEFDPTDASTPALGATLSANYPNPFNPSTRIEFSLERAGAVDLSVYDLTGRRIATLERGVLAAGDHAATWNGLADDGTAVASGQYRYVLETAKGRTSRGMVLLK